VGDRIINPKGRPRAPRFTERTGRGEVEAQDAATQVAIGKRDCVARTECDVLKGAAILAERDLAFGASVEVVEHRPGHSATRHGADASRLQCVPLVQVRMAEQRGRLRRIAREHFLVVVDVG
jgi:hypothetical protein